MTYKMLQNYAQVKDSCKMQQRPVDFNITEYEKVSLSQKEVSIRL